MRIVTATVVVVLVALAMFSLLNWSAIVKPTTLSFGFVTRDAPLGAVLLAFCALLTLSFLASTALQQARSLSAARKAARELEAHRALATDAEQSRFVQLRSYLESELRALRGSTRAPPGDAEPDDGRIERAFAKALIETTNVLEAHLGEIEDKLDRALRDERSTGAADLEQRH